jgi:hypothetical protein
MLVGCGPSLIWSGHTADRRHRIEVVERAGLSYVIIDGQRRAAYHGVAGWSIALAGDHVAFAARVDDRWRVVVDGRAGEDWDEIGGIEILPDGTAIYIAARAGRWHVVVGRTTGPGFDAIVAGSLRFTSDHVAYAGRRGTQVHVVHDGREHRGFDGVGQLELSRDGSRSIYAGRRGDDAYVVVDGVERSRWGAVSRLTLGPDTHWAHAASEGHGWRLVVDGHVGPVVDSIRSIVFRDDGSQVVWTAMIEGIAVLSLDEHPIAALSLPARFALRPSRAGQELAIAYVIDAGAKQQRVVVGTQVGPIFDEIGTLVWSFSGRLAYTARRDTKWLVVVDGSEQDGGDRVGPPTFSLDGERVGFIATRGKASYAIVDGAAHRFDLVFEDSITFSSDGAHWAVIAGDVAREQLFIAIDGDRQRVVLSAREIYSAATAHDPEVLRAWIAAELARCCTR